MARKSLLAETAQAFREQIVDQLSSDYDRRELKAIVNAKPRKEHLHSHLEREIRHLAELVLLNWDQAEAEEE